jgi:hypothetical protein
MKSEVKLRFLCFIDTVNDDDKYSLYKWAPKAIDIQIYSTCGTKFHHVHYLSNSWNLTMQLTEVPLKHLFNYSQLFEFLDIFKKIWKSSKGCNFKNNFPCS